MKSSVHPVEVASSPHIGAQGATTRRMMADVLIGLAPVLAMALYVFRWYAVVQVGMCVLTCLAAERIFALMRGNSSTLNDFSATVTGVILGLSLPWSAPWYVAVIASAVAIGIGKAVFGGLGQNIFNPAMVGRAFVMISFPAALGAGAYQAAALAGRLDVVTRATPLTLAKQLGEDSPLWALFTGTLNGSLGETSAIACLLGGLYLCLRRVAAWQIPVGVVVAVAVLASFSGGGQVVFSIGHHLLAGAVMFGAFFIATDPVTSPVTPMGKFIFGLGVGLLIMLIRKFSGYPEGVMFAVLLMNSVVPVIDRWMVPRPVGGQAPAEVRRQS